MFSKALFIISSKTWLSIANNISYGEFYLDIGAYFRIRGYIFHDIKRNQLKHDSHVWNYVSPSIFMPMKESCQSNKICYQTCEDVQLINSQISSEYWFILYMPIDWKFFPKENWLTR